MAEDRPVSVEVHHEIEQFLFKEARMLNGELFREWLEQFIDPRICYRLAIGEERFRAERNATEASEVLPFDDDFAMLERRVRQVESGRRTMIDPPEKLRRYITNVETYQGGVEDEFRVHSCGLVTRNRRQTEHEQIEYGREDVLRRGEGGALCVVSRRIEIDQRVIQGKNLLFFL